MTDIRNQGHIVALGGGGFSMEPENALLDDFILSLSRRRPARVCFIPTASADAATYITKFYRAFSGRCIPTDLTLFDSPALPRRPALTKDLAAFVRAQDVFYVGGGNTANLLAVWRAHGLDVLLRRAWRAGAVLSGISAGMLCWFEGGLTDSFGSYQALDAASACFGAPHARTTMASRRGRRPSAGWLRNVHRPAMPRTTARHCTLKAGACAKSSVRAPPRVPSACIAEAAWPLRPRLRCATSGSDRRRRCRD